MSAVGSVISCPEIQDTLNQHFNGLTGQVPVTDQLVPFLLSPINTQGVIQNVVSPGNSRIRTIELVYQPRMVESEISESSVLRCTGGDNPGELSTQYTVQDDEGVAYEWSIEPNDLIRNCRDNNVWVTREIMRVMDGLGRKIDTIVADQIALNTGPFRDGSMTKTTTTIQTGVDPAYDAIEDIRFEFADLEFNQTPFVFGFNEIYRYFNRVQAACCADIGMDLSEFAAQNPVAFLKDRKVQDALGSNNFLAVAPGAIQLLQFHEFEDSTGTMQFDEPTHKQGTLRDPRNGLIYDYFAEYSCGKWNFQLKLAIQAAFLPNDLFQADDDLFQTNWVQEFVIDNS